LKIPEDYLTSLHKVVRHQLAVQPVKVGTEVDVTSFVGGIEDIKNALKVGLQSAAGEFDIKIQLISSPTFVIFTTTTDETAGIEAIEGVMSVIKEEIVKVGGGFDVKKPPAIIGKELNVGKEAEGDDL